MTPVSKVVIISVVSGSIIFGMAMWITFYARFAGSTGQPFFPFVVIATAAVVVPTGVILHYGTLAVVKIKRQADSDGTWRRKR